MTDADTGGPRLALAQASGRGRPLPLPDTGALLIGSDATTATLVLAGEGVRPTHAAVAKLKGGGFGVVAVEGAPLSVNGAPTQSARLSEGDRIAIGPHELRVVAERSTTALRVPDRIAGFRVVRRIGAGAMGQVFLAVQESLAREVALKVLRPELAADAAFVRRFEAEARAAAALGHPNVVTVYDVGQAPGTEGAPLHYLAMEYMARGSLEERLTKEGPLPASDVIAALRDAARGLEYAESRGLVHRDLKPANLMQDGSGVVKIADLGLALEAEASAGERAYGTAHFASPEQVRREKLDSRSDLYSLGASAYRLLSGETPFQGATRREILEKVLAEPPRPLAPLSRGAPADLVALIERLLAKDPSKRAQSAAAFAREIDALALRHAHGKPGSRKRTLAVLATIALVAFGIAFALRRAQDTTDADRSARTGPETLPGRIALPADDDSWALDAPPATDGARLGGEDAALRAIEEDAREALARAETLEDPSERALALSELATRFPGTSAARRAHELLEGGTDAAGDDVAALARREAFAAFASGVRAAVAPTAVGTPAPPAEVERRLSALLVPPVLADDEEVLRVLSGEVARHVDSAGAFADRAFELAEAALVGGDFDGWAAALEGFLAWSAPSPDTAGADAAAAPAALPTANAFDLVAARAAAPTGLLRIEERRARAVGDLERRALLEERYEAAMAQRDRAHTGTAIGGGAALAEALATLDLARASAHLRAAVQGARSRTERATLEGLAQRLADGPRAFEALQRSHAAGEWRRRNVPVPGRRTLMAEIVRFEPDGMIAVAGGEEVPVKWKDFAGKSQEVAQLFGQRLTREWTQDEAASIAVVATISALAELLQEALGVLDPAANVRLSPGEYDSIRASFDRAREWAVAGRVESWFEYERSAALLVARALRGVDQNEPVAIAWALERAFEEAPDGLAVRALSDGRTLGAVLAWPPPARVALTAPLPAPATAETTEPNDP